MLVQLFLEFNLFLFCLNNLIVKCNKLIYLFVNSHSYLTSYFTQIVINLFLGVIYLFSDITQSFIQIILPRMIRLDSFPPL